MTYSLSHLQPQEVWQNFYTLTQIPRPSKHEEKIQAFMLDFGKQLGLETIQDEVGNIIIKKPATSGNEDRQGVVLQAHLDMVPQANSDSAHDFVNDPITPVVDGEWVRAKQTTLGADNGIGVAAIMAVLASKTIEHGPLEALLTCDEETSMMGAMGLKPDVLDGQILLNLDSEDEKELYIGCAGGIDAEFTLPLVREVVPTLEFTCQITLKGLRGGHSGVDINQQSANANKQLMRFLSTLTELESWRLQSFEGGSLSNAIPREAKAIIRLSQQAMNKLPTQIAAFQSVLQKEYRHTDPELTLTMTPISELDDNLGGHIVDPIGDNLDDPLKDNAVLTQRSQHLLLSVINACPNGVHRMSTDIAELVETSNNLAVVHTDKQQVVIQCLLRSSLDSARDELMLQMRAVFELAGAKCHFFGAYPGWQPNLDSPILTVMEETGKALFGETPKQYAIHAGLECGILGGTYPHWDMISFGPTIRAPHSPDEKVNIASVSHFYDWLLATLKAIPKAA